jgi:hypothetical protein
MEMQVKEAALAGIELLVVPFTINEAEANQLSPHVISDLHKRKFTDRNIPKLLQYAYNENIKVGFLIEKYLGRTETKVFLQIKYLLTKYKGYKSFFPIFYIYDAHDLNMKSVLSKTASYEPVSIRKLYHNMVTKASAHEEDGTNTVKQKLHEKIYVISSWVHPDSGVKAYEDGYDGLFTYFASDKHAYGSNISNWKAMNAYSSKNDMLFIPSISPGYDDLKVRPWNSEMVVERYTSSSDDEMDEKEFYFTKRCDNALAELSEHPPRMLLINSFNDWVHGTQIEPAMPVTIPPLEQCDPSRKGNRMCKRLQRQLNIDGTYYGYLGETSMDDYTTQIQTGNPGIVTNNVFETSGPYHYLKLAKKCIKKMFE